MAGCKTTVLKRDNLSPSAPAINIGGHIRLNKITHQVRSQHPPLLSAELTSSHSADGAFKS